MELRWRERVVVVIRVRERGRERATARESLEAGRGGDKACLYGAFAQDID